MVKRKPQQVWTYDTIGSNPPSTVDSFYMLLNAQNWGRAEMLAVEVFRGRLGIAILPLDMTERLMVGMTFIWMCGESEEVVWSYIPLWIFPSIYSIAQEHRLLCEGARVTVEEPLHSWDTLPLQRSYEQNGEERQETWHPGRGWK